MIPLLVRWQSVVDFVVLTVALYILLRLAQQARALRVALAVLGRHAGALVSRRFDLALTSWVLDGAAILTIEVRLAWTMCWHGLHFVGPREATGLRGISNQKMRSRNLRSITPRTCSAIDRRAS